MVTTPRQARRRQARGERRMAQVLDTAAKVFAEVGYDTATTNAIAVRAGMSPGSLYQFFANKEAIAEALATRYIEQLQAARDAALEQDLAAIPLDELLNRMLDPLIAFNLANPGFQSLFADPRAPQRLTAAKQQVHQAILHRVEGLLAARATRLSPTRRTRCAEVAIQIFKALLPLIMSAHDEERAALIQELKAALRGYLIPLLDGARHRR